MLDTAILRKMRLFRTLEPADLLKARKLLRIRKCLKGRTIILEGSRGDCIYLVKKGTLKVTHMLRGKPRELGTFQLGDHFGEVSFIDKKPRSATIYATEDSELFIVTRKAFETLLYENPHLQIMLMQALLEDLCGKLRDRNDILDSEVSDLLPVSIFETDTQGNILYANRSGLEYFGYTLRDFEKGINFFQMIIPEDRQRGRANFRSVLKLEKLGPVEYTAQRNDQSTFAILVHSDPIMSRNKAIGIRGTIIDITARKKTEETLGRLEKAVETIQLGVTIANIKGHILYTNPAEASMHGYNREELIGKHVSILAPAENCHPEGWQEIRNMRSWMRESLNARKDGPAFPVQLTSDVVLSAHGDPIGVVTTCEDITHRKSMESELRRNALYDPLTKLPNRNLFNDRIIQAIKRKRRSKDNTFAVLFMDLDNFKQINDSLGHVVGDQLLIETAHRLLRCLRPADTVARFGGDEFIILLDGILGVTEAAQVADRIENALNLPFVLDGHEVFTTASIGITMGGPGKPEDLIREADAAMYEAKMAGKAGFKIFNQSSHSSSDNNAALPNSVPSSNNASTTGFQD